MNKRREMDIIGLSIEDTKFLEDIVEKSVEEEIVINRQSFEEGIQYNRDVPVVLTSGAFLLEEAKKNIPGQQDNCRQADNDGSKS